jgi:hypothetical protein
MIALAISVLWVLIALVVLVGIGWVALWVLGQLGVIVPPMAIKLTMIVLGLLVLIYFLSLVGSGGTAFPGFYGRHVSTEAYATVAYTPAPAPALIAA